MSDATENVQVSDESIQQDNSGSAPVEAAPSPSSEDVSYESHQRLLQQRKADQRKAKELEQELSRYRDADRAREQQELEAKGEYSKILSERENRIQELEAREEERLRREVESAKLNAFVRALPGKLRSQDYLAFVNTDDIPLDPESKSVDEGSLRRVVADFMSKHSVLVEPEKKVNVPNQAPAPSAINLGTDNKSSNEQLIELLAKRGN